MKRIIFASIVLVFGSACADEPSQDLGRKELPGLPAGDPVRSAGNSPPSASSSVRVQEPVSDPVQQRSAPGNDCKAQGIGDEEDFAREVCLAARDFGFRAQLVHSYGAGGVDVFITEEAAQQLALNRAALERNTRALTEWAKRNYSGFNAVEVTIVGDARIARGSKLGSRPTTVELYGN